MKFVFTLIVVLHSVFLVLADAIAAPPAAVPSADEILKKSVRSVYAPGEQSVYVMKLMDKDGGSKARKMRVWFKRDGDEKAKLLIKFSEPAEIRGTGLLSILEKEKTPDQWLYLPAYKKVRRIKGGNENESFLGSDFTVGDLNADNENQYAYVVSGSTRCGDTECFVLTGTPKAGLDASAGLYSKKVLQIRKDNYIGTGVQFYDAEGKLEKVLELKGLKRDGNGRWMADRMEMKSLLNGSRTVIEAEKRDVSGVPADSVFTQAHLERG